MKDIAIVLGIRPDVIRASKILKLLNNQNQMNLILFGQVNIILKI